MFFYPIIRKVNFRFKNNLWLISALLFCFISPYGLSAPHTSRQQVYALVVKQMEKDIDALTKQNGWYNYVTKPDVFIPADVINYVRCQKPLIISSSTANGSRSDLTRIRYAINCNDKKNWQVLVTVKPNVTLPIILVKSAIERGSVITLDDIELKRYNISNARQGFLVNTDEVLGLTAKRRLRIGQPLLPSQLDYPLLIKRGQHVLMIASQEDLEIKTMGEAMSDGHQGQVIKVKNLSSGKVVMATVEEEGVVRIIMF